MLLPSGNHRRPGTRNLARRREKLHGSVVSSEIIANYLINSKCKCSVKEKWEKNELRVEENVN